jgi:uncharacterized protein YbjT (DUF2867 family)
MTLPILVTGGTGHLGRRDVRRLMAAGCGIRVLTRHGRPAAAGPDGRRQSAGDEHGEATAATVGGSE